MKKQRGSDNRAKVDIPIRFTYEDEEKNHKISSHGRIEDISINGMCVELPLSAELIEKKHLDFDLDLPNPFIKIKGQGHIQWKRWDAQKNCTTCGLKLAPMTLSQLSDWDMIISEVLEDQTTVK
ncbi:PilZ domain-containing protein [bacterium]|nr:PilZ domain-containing protein [bacterium]